MILLPIAGGADRLAGSAGDLRGTGVACAESESEGGSTAPRGGPPQPSPRRPAGGASPASPSAPSRREASGIHLAGGLPGAGPRQTRACHSPTSRGITLEVETRERRSEPRASGERARAEGDPSALGSVGGAAEPSRGRAKTLPSSALRAAPILTDSSLVGKLTCLLLFYVNSELKQGSRGEPRPGRCEPGELD